MLTTLVPGVGMGGLPFSAVPPGSGNRFMLLLGVGRAFFPFLLGEELIRHIIIHIFSISHLSNIG